MAQLYDDLGRLVESQRTANLTLQEIKSLIANSAKAAVGNAKPFAKGGDSTASTDKLVKLFEKYAKNFKKSVKEQKDYLKQMVDFLKEKEKSKKEKPPQKRDKNSSKESVWKNLENLAKKGLKKNSVDKATGGGGGGGGVGGGGGHGRGGGGGGHGRNVHMTALTVSRLRESAIKNILGLMEEQILGYNVMDRALEGILDKEREFVKDARKLAYETEGATKDSKNLLRTFEDIGKSSKLTGKTRQQFIDRYTKSVKMGLKDLKKVHAITIAQLNTEEQLGLEAGSLGDTFVDWARGLKFNEGQIAEMGRGMRDIARFTGMTGEALEEVAKNSQSYVDNLKLAGTATAAQVKNIIELAANFKRVGIDGSKLMDAMTSTNKLLSANTSTFALLAKAANQAGIYGTLFSGTLLQSKESMKGINRELMRTINQFGVAGNSVEEIRANWEKLSDDTKSRINIQLKAAFDVEAGELMGTIEAFEQSSQTLADKLANANNKLQKNITLEERKVILEEQRKLKLSASLNALTALDEAAKSSKNMGDALAKFNSRKGEFEADMKALGVAWTNEANVAKGAIQNAMDSVNKGLKDVGKQELKIDSSEIERALKDPVAFRELTAKITKAEQEASTAAKAQLDPLSSAAQSLIQINDTLRNLANSGFSTIFNSAIGKIVVVIGAILSALLGASKIWNEIKQQFEYLKQAFDPVRYARNWDLLGQLAVEGLKDHSIGVKDTKSRMQLMEISKQLGNIETLLSRTPTTSASKQAKPTEAEDALKNKDTKPQASPTTDFDAGILSKLGSDFAKNAAAIAAFAVGITALGAAIIFLGKNIIDFLGLDMATVMQTATTIGTIVTAGAAIAGAAIGIYKLLETKESKDFIEGAKTSYTDVLKMAGSILLIGPALVLLGAALVWMCQKIIRGFGLDILTVAETAGAIATIAAAAGGIAFGVNEAIEALNEFKNSPLFKNPSEIITPMLKGAAAMLVLAPAIVLLASGIVWMSQKILGAFGLSATKTAAVATDVGAIILAAGAIALGVIGAAGGLSLLGALVTSLGDFTGGIGLGAAIILMGKGALALGLLTPAILLLGISIVKMSKGLMSVTGVNLGVAAKVAKDVAGILGAAAFIAGACMLSAFALSLLGLWLGSPAAIGMVPLILAGARAILTLIPAMILLSSAILLLSKSMMQKSGLDLTTSKTIAENVAGIIGAAGMIAGACLGAAASLSLLGLAVTTGIFWQMSTLMIPGAIAISFLTPTMIKMSQSILEMARGLMKVGINPQTTSGIAENVSKLIEAAGNIAGSVLKGAGHMALLGALVSSNLVWGMVGLMFLGAKAFQTLAPAILRMTMAIVMLGQAAVKAGGIDSQTNVAENISKLIESAGKIAGSVLKVAGYVMLLGALVSSNLVLGMFLKSKALGIAVPRFQKIFNYIIDFVKEGVIDPINSAFRNLNKLNQVVNVSKTIVSLMSTIGPMIDSITKVVLDLTKRPSFLIILSKRSKSEKLEEAIPQFQATFEKIVNFIKEGVIGPITNTFRNFGKINQTIAIAKSIGDSVVSIVNIVDILGNKIAPMTKKGGWWAKNFGDARSKMEKIAGMMPDFSRVFSIMVGFLKNSLIGIVVASFPNLQSVSGVLPIVESVGKTITAITEIMDSLVNKLAPMAQKGSWLARKFIGVRSPLEKLEAAKPDIEKSFLSIVGFVRGILNSVQSAFPDLKKAESSIGIIKKVGQSLSSIQEIMDTFQEISQTVNPWSGASLIFGNIFHKVNPLQTNIPKIQQTFLAITKFVQEGIVQPISAINAKDLSKSVPKLRLMSQAIKSIEDTINSVQNTMTELLNLTKSKFTNNQFANTKIADSYKSWFKWVVYFAREAIIRPMGDIGEIGELKIAAKKMNLSARVLNATPTIIDGLINSMNGIMDLGNDKFTRSGSKNTAIANRYKDWFEWIAYFAKTAIIEPAKSLGEVYELQMVSKTMCSAANILVAFPKIIRGLNGAMNAVSELAARKFLTTKDKNKEIANRYKDWFEWVICFTRTAIIEPANELGDIKKLATTAKTITYAEKILTSTPRIIMGLGKAMEEIRSLAKNKFTSSESKNTQIATRYRNWFEWIAYFARVAIVEPVRTQFTDIKKLIEASRIVSAMQRIIASTPRIIIGLAQTMSLMSNTGDALDESFPLDKIMLYKDRFEGWFRDISAFLRDGIIDPIRTEIPEPKTILLAQRILTAMSAIVSRLPTMIGNLSKMFMPMNPNECISDSPVSMLIQGLEQFKSWFWSVASFLREGIIWPITNSLPKDEEIAIAKTNLGITTAILMSMSPLIQNLAGAATNLVDVIDKQPLLGIGGQASKFAYYWDGISRIMNEGIISPINKNLPSYTEINEAARRINSLADVMLGLKNSLDLLSQVMREIHGMNIDMEIIKAFPIPELAALGRMNGINPSIVMPRGQITEIQAVESARNLIYQQTQRASGAVGLETIRPVTPTASALPPVADIHSQMRQNVAATEPTTTQVNSPELSEIAAAAAEEVDQTKQMVTLLEQMLRIFKGESAKVGSGRAADTNTSANNIAQKPNNYYRWPTGNQFQQGAKQVLNLGTSIV